MRNLPDDETSGFESIHDLAASLQALHHRAVRAYTPLVEGIVQSGSRDVHEIEQTLDGLLGFCSSAACVELYRKLCRYYLEIDPAATADYVRAYREMWDQAGEDEGTPHTPTNGGDA